MKCWVGLLAAMAFAAPGAASAQALVIDHVTVLSMAAGSSPQADRTVVVDAGRIVSISAFPGQAPRGAKHVDGRGQWLMPGLTDMHVHLENERQFALLTGKSAAPGAIDPADLFLPYIARGVTQIVNMSAMSEDVGVRRQVEAGQLLGPHLLLAAMIDGSPPIWPVGMSHVATTPEAGRQAVRDMKADGFDLIKVYSNLDYATFQAVADEAHKLKMKVVGHIPGRNQGQTERWLTDGLDMVAHAEEFAYQTPTIAEAEARIPAYAAMAKARGVGLEATLTTNQRILEQMREPQTLNTRPELDYVHPLTRSFWAISGLYSNSPPARIQRNVEVVAFTARLAKAFSAAGVPVFVGTDTSVPGLAAGAALEDEMEALAAAGLPARTILESATREASAWLGVGDDRGTVEAGKRADLLLLSADPLASVSNLRKVSGVIRDGRYYPRAELDRRMTALRARYLLQSKSR